MALFARRSRLPVHGRHSPAAGGSTNGPQYLDRWIGAVRGLMAGHIGRSPDTRPVDSSACYMTDTCRECRQTRWNRAKDDATRVVRALAGIDLVWIDAEACQARCLTVRIITRADQREEPQSARGRHCARDTERRAGNSHGSSIDSHQGIQRGASDCDASQLLGHVMAHELGHLLLPHGAHSVAGVMRPEWDRAQVQAAAEGLLTFTPDQADLIRARLSASASPIAHAR